MNGSTPYRVLAFVGIAAALAAIAPLRAQTASVGAPETFGAKAQASTKAGASVTAPILFHVERYTPDFDRGVVQEALRVGGYPGFLPALRKAPDVGYAELASRRVTIRWARETVDATGRTIVLITDKPVAFLGGQAEGKSRAGYEVAVIQLKVDAKGNGTGTMAAAARVKPGGATGVQIDDYAEVPITLAMVARQ
jgi:hypothetical protein